MTLPSTEPLDSPVPPGRPPLSAPSTTVVPGGTADAAAAPVDLTCRTDPSEMRAGLGGDEVRRVRQPPSES